jgi:hypothetical protein
MSDFKTTAEIWQYLLDGGKVTLHYWPAIRYIHIVDGFVVTDRGGKDEESFCAPVSWSKYQEPKHPPLKLHDGIDVTKLQTREGGEVLFVVNRKSMPRPYLAVVRDTDKDIWFFGYTETGSRFLSDEDMHDIIWKEGT